MDGNENARKSVMHVESCCFANLRPRMIALDLLGLLGTVVLDWLTQTCFTRGTTNLEALPRAEY